MTAPINSGAPPHDLAPSGPYSGYLGNHRTATELAQLSATDTAFLASDQFRKIQSTAQQALAQCMELGLHVLPIHRAEQRDLLAAKLLEAAYEGVGSASTSRDLGPTLPRLTALVQLIATHGAHLQRQSSVQQPEEHTVNGYGTGPNRGSCSMQITDTWDRDQSNNLPEGTFLWQNSPMGATEATNSSRKRQAEEYTGDVMGSRPKRQQTEHGPNLPVSAEMAVSSTAPTSNVASLMTSLEQEVSQDLAQWSETRSAGILDGISTKIEGADTELERRAAAAAEVGHSAAQAAAEQQAQAAALAKIDAINSRLARAGVAPHVVPAGAPSIADALAAKFAAANASFMQGQPGLPPPAALPTALPAAPVTAAATVAAPPEAAFDAAKLAALDAKLAQFQQPSPPASGGPALAPATTSNLALLDAKLARYGAAPELPANGLYQQTLQAPNMGYAPHLAAAPFPANGTGVLPGAGMLGATRPILSSGPASWPGALGGQASGAQLAWQPAVGGQQAHLGGAMPGANAIPMGSLPRGIPQNGMGMHPLGAAVPYMSAPGAAPVSRPFNGPDVKARLQQEALARLQQVNKGWK
ncbi:g3029 [Coccomyxa elongata]